MNDNAEYRVQAEFIVVDPRLILSNAQLLIRNGRIVELSETTDAPPDLLLAGSTLLPGFINSHTHLEFSDLTQPFPAGPNFPAWIASVVGHRRRQLGSCTASQLQKIRQRTIAAGLRKCRRLGTAALVDIVTPPWSMEHPFDQAEAVSSSESALLDYPQVIALPELLGVDLPRFQQSWDWACELLERAGRGPLQQPLVHLGLSPHAPYSLIHPNAIGSLRHIPAQAILAMHVAESLEERQWLEQGSGPFLDLYQRIGLPIDAPRMQIAEAIELLASRPQSLLIHGNYLLESELNRLAQSSIAVVYCPRTHLHFGHSHYPLRSMRERSIPVILGTDSRASNPDLSIWRECCMARKLHSSCWSASDSLAAITTVPAQILGLEQDLGSLHPGRMAYLNVVNTPEGATSKSLLDQLIWPEREEPQPLFSDRSSLGYNQ